MTAGLRVTVTSRRPGPVEGFTTVVALVADGDNGEYIIHTDLVGTPGEEREILAQSDTRMELRRAAKPGID